LDQIKLKLFRNLIRWTNLSIMAIISSVVCELCIILMLIGNDNFKYSNLYLMGLDAGVAAFGIHLSMSYSETTYRNLCTKCHWCCQKCFKDVSDAELEPRRNSKSMRLSDA